MLFRVLLSAGVVALVATSCAQTEPQVLSEAPRSVSATDVTSQNASGDREDVQSGRFIARCATEADGGTPGTTYFTDGSQNVTDHCLSRYYIGVQPAPGALYVPDEEAGTAAPQREGTSPEPASTGQWTPAQPRTDAGGRDVPRTEDDGLSDESTAPDTDPSETGTTTPSTPPGTDTPGQTSPGESTTPTESTPPGTTEPEAGAPGTGDTDPTTTGSSQPSTIPTEVPSPTTQGTTPDQNPAPSSAEPTGSLGTVSATAPSSAAASGATSPGRPSLPPLGLPH